MITVKFIVFAKSSSIDFNTQLLSVFEIIEELSSEKLPAFVQESKIIIIFERDMEKDPQKQEVVITMNK